MPDIQEQILFLPPVKGINERNLRTVVDTVEWEQQRKLFQTVTERLLKSALAARESLASMAERFRCSRNSVSLLPPYS